MFYSFICLKLHIQWSKISLSPFALTQLSCTGASLYTAKNKASKRHIQLLFCGRQQIVGDNCEWTMTAVWFWNKSLLSSSNPTAEALGLPTCTIVQIKVNNHYGLKHVSSFPCNYIIRNNYSLKLSKLHAVFIFIF